MSLQQGGVPSSACCLLPQLPRMTMYLPLLLLCCSAAHLTYYGSCSATLAPSPGTQVQVGGCALGAQAKQGRSATA